MVQKKEGRVSAKKQGVGLPINDDPGLEKEADEMGARAAQGKMADVQKKGSGVQKRPVEGSGNVNDNGEKKKENSTVGEYKWQQTDTWVGWWHDYQINVQNRSVDEWKKFLINDADTREGGIELNLYLGTALYGKNAFYNSLTADHATKIKLTDYIKDSGIVQPENLMIALLTVGDKMDLQDSPYEGGGSRISKDSLLKLINGFTAKYSAQALMSLKSDEYKDDNIKDFLEASIGDGFNSGAAYFGDEFNYGNVHVKLINGALAAAFGHMNELILLTINNEGKRLVARDELSNQTANMGATVGTSIKTMEDIRESEANLNMAVFESMLAVSTAGVGSVISGAVKAALLAAASELVKNGVKSLSSNKDNSEKAEDFAANFKGTYVSLLTDLQALNIDEETKENVFINLNFLKEGFLRELGDCSK